MKLIPVLSVLFPEGEETLTDVVERHKQAGADCHREVIRELLNRPAEHRPAVRGTDPADQRNRDKVGEGVANRNVEREAQNGLEALFLILEGEVLVEEVAHHAADDISEHRGDPNIPAEKVVEQKLQTGSDKSVDDSHKNKSYHNISIK